ncbi:cytochrome d ubiquinol oxidase subunit II [Roseiterribacter gracilis]|uniref:Ubiquinol oxidase subunit II, cyanide insensitive n=1 Tax=Roseiterribacter gracilis TaxID=2812848 RepID=A0A8S8XDH0_9PROT|nr:ubiquinol oxidase subunit II, cyanide insensitive [Rhodospirillales bacterium TMPK1]
MSIDLPLIWAGIIVVGVFMYVLLDGFDLGIGILFPFAPDDAARDKMMNSVAPIWDGNETWLVLGGAGLLAAFPAAYSIILSALYLPLIVMLLGLTFRGVAFEFRFKANTSRYLWDRSFQFGSLIATFTQGVVLGAFVQGFHHDGITHTGGPFDWLTPFALMTGVALVAGYALLGATWLVMKTEGALQAWARKVSVTLLIAVTIFIAVVSLWVPFLETDIFQRWFTWPNLLYLSPVPLAVLVLFLYLVRALRRDDTHVQPFVLTLGLFALSYLGLGISLWPNVVPPNLSIWTASSPPESQGFLLWGAVFIVPMVIGYTGYSYWIFRGKVADDGYHH